MYISIYDAQVKKAYCVSFSDFEYIDYVSAPYKTVINNGKHSLIPKDISGTENYCRNEPDWPFGTADPICPVWSSEFGAATLDLCSVQHCSPKRTLFNSLLT